MKIFHADVFSSGPLTGNGLMVIFPDIELNDKELQRIACEFKQFETIFLWQQPGSEFAARIFTTTEELDFAGHPVLGAAAVIHQDIFHEDCRKSIIINLSRKSVRVESTHTANGYNEVMNQGKAEFIQKVSPEWREIYCRELNIDQENLYKEYPMEVVSTGLPYLLIPIKGGLESVRIKGDTLEKLLAKNQAKFTYTFDVEHMEGRTWDNSGSFEDVATGSAAGPVGAYLLKYGLAKPGQEISLSQGRFLNRPSILKITCLPESGDICVAGDVSILMNGELTV